MGVRFLSSHCGYITCTHSLKNIYMAGFLWVATSMVGPFYVVSFLVGSLVILLPSLIIFLAFLCLFSV